MVRINLLPSRELEDLKHFQVMKIFPWINHEKPLWGVSSLVYARGARKRYLQFPLSSIFLVPTLAKLRGNSRPSTFIEYETWPLVKTSD